MNRLQLLQAQRKRRERANVTAFNALITTPEDGEFTMPANGRIRFVSVEGCAAGTTAATLTGAKTRTIKTPLLEAGGVVRLDHVERGVVVTPEAGFQVELDCGFGVWRTIAEVE
jgi:hypothetical protein